MWVTPITHLLLIVLSCFFQNVLSAADFSDISRLRAKILENYDNYTRPVQNHSDTTVVYMNFLNYGFYVIIFFINHEEQRNLMTFNLLTVMRWEDQHIKWDPLNYGNLTEVTFFPTEIWRPEINVVNNFDESEIDHFANALIIALPDSDVWWIPPTKFQVHCAFDFRLWPYDKQTCRVVLSSWTHHGLEIDLAIPENLTELLIDNDWQDGHFNENREWKLLRSSVERISRVVYCCPEIPIVGIFITVDIQRRFSTHTAAITVVGLGIATAVLISFWLDPFAKERLPLTLLLLLLNSIYLQYMHRVIPNNGSNVPLSVSFFRDSLIMVMFAFTWTVGIRYIAKIKRDTPVPLPNFIESFLNSIAASILCLNPRPQSKGQAQRKLQESSEDDHGDVSELVGEDSENIREDWEWLARFLDRIAFFGYLATYIIFIAAFL